MGTMGRFAWIREHRNGTIHSNSHYYSRSIKEMKVIRHDMLLLIYVTCFLYILLLSTTTFYGMFHLSNVLLPKLYSIFGGGHHYHHYAFFRWSTWHVLPLLFFIVFAYLTKTLHLGSLVSFVSLDPPDSWLSPGNKHQVSYWYLYYLLHKNWCDENNLLFNNINNADYQSVHMLKCRQWSTLWFIFYCC